MLNSLISQLATTAPVLLNPGHFLLNVEGKFSPSTSVVVTSELSSLLSPAWSFTMLLFDFGSSFSFMAQLMTPWKLEVLSNLGMSRAVGLRSVEDLPKSILSPLPLPEFLPPNFRRSVFRRFALTPQGTTTWEINEIAARSSQRRKRRTCWKILIFFVLPFVAAHVSRPDYRRSSNNESQLGVHVPYFFSHCLHLSKRDRRNWGW